MSATRDLTENIAIGSSGRAMIAAASPCYFYRVCGNLAEVANSGKGVCRKCSAKMRGFEWPLENLSRRRDRSHFMHRDQYPVDWFYGNSRKM